MEKNIAENWSKSLKLVINTLGPCRSTFDLLLLAILASVARYFLGIPRTTIGVYLGGPLNRR
jgi:hypothetical protein